MAGTGCFYFLSETIFPGIRSNLRVCIKPGRGFQVINKWKKGNRVGGGVTSRSFRNRMKLPRSQSVQCNRSVTGRRISPPLLAEDIVKVCFRDTSCPFSPFSFRETRATQMDIRTISKRMMRDSLTVRSIRDRLLAQVCNKGKTKISYQTNIPFSTFLR